MAITVGAEPPKEKSKVPLLDYVPLNEPVAVKADRIPGFADAADQSSGIEKLAHARQRIQEDQSWRIIQFRHHMYLACVLPA